MVKILTERLARIDEVKLRSGPGRGVNGGIDVCAMQLANWLAGGDGKSDLPECVDPVIRRFMIELNDATTFGTWRDELKPFVIRSVGTKTNREATEQRTFMCADWAVREIAPMTFSALAETFPESELSRASAKKLRDVPLIVDAKSAHAAKDVALEVHSATAYTTNTAAAYATSAAAVAAAEAAAAAEYAIGVATYATSAAVAAAEAVNAGVVWNELLKLLDRLIAVTEVSEE
jgi:hypothetical protein